MSKGVIMTVSRTLILAGLVIASFSACGSESAGNGAADTATSRPTSTVDITADPTTPPDTATLDTSPDTAPATSEVPTTSDEVIGPGEMAIRLVECEQFPMVAQVDAAAARSLVPADVEVVLDDAGMATFTHVSKSCDDIVVDGV
jgi:hypothetical protein